MKMNVICTVLDVSVVFLVIFVYLSRIGCSRGVGLPVSGGAGGRSPSQVLWFSRVVSLREPLR